MNDNKILKLVYTFFLGILLSIFLGLGINTFYEPPKMPEYPNSSVMYDYDDSQNEERQQLQQSYDEEFRQYTEDMKPYNRNVSIMVMVGAILFLVISMVYEKRMQVISDGIMLGGLFSLVYGIGRGFAASDSKYVFITVTAGLVAVLYLGYHRFIKEPANMNSRRKK